ncbi:hypothetical protein OJAV_G00134220 [Oryzias javanicus]|uniref:Myb/SANT-like DNA-binding domain-containing protein n=1 Tax=Oryzias javanicus TaxID=123683 RepID=A0A3S2MRB1_ORYJA|nr:hypothetical protein OJAV_G00134220 [Oryzias javanicus]
MATKWREEDEEFKIGGMTGGMKTKPRFSFHEIRMLLHAVRKNRFVLLKKFNRGVSAEAKKQTWAVITAEINGLGENQREVRQIMKKWADLKCDGKRRITAMRGPNGNNLRKKKMGPVERMVHKILMLTPETESISDQDLDEDEDLTKYTTPPSATHFSYLSMSDTSRSLPGEALDVSPTSTPDKDLGEPLQSSSDLDAPDEEEPVFENDSASSSYPAPLPPPQSAPLPPPQPAVLLDFTQLKLPPDAPPPPPAAVANGTSSPPAPVAPSPPAKAPSSVCPPPVFSSLPVGVPQRQEQVSALAAQSLRQQAAGRVLLSSVSQSLEALAQSVQLLVESQQELVQEALLLQRETVEVLRDFSNTALGMLRDKAAPGSRTPCSASEGGHPQTGTLGGVTVEPQGSELRFLVKL